MQTHNNKTLCPYISEVDDEAVAAVEAGPAEGDLRGPDDPPALDVEEPLCWKVIGDHVV